MAIKVKIDGNSRISLSDDQLFDQSTANTSGGTDSTSGNTFIGYLAGQNVDAGSVNNTFIGHGVGDATLADATYNVGVGTNALTALTSGEGNTAIGTYAGQSITSGARNTILGYGALGAANGDEDFNTIIGHGAGASIDHDSADNNIIIGYDAGSGGSAAMASCIAIGNNAMNSTAGNAQTGTVAIGHDALTALTDGTGNTAIGYEAGAALTSGTQNVAIGYEALDRASSGANHNVAIGYQSMHGNIGTDDVDECVAIGSYAIEGGLANAASGTVAIGYKALTANTDGGQNTGIGFEVLKSQTTGGGNTAVGYQALHDLNHANADSNVAIGAYAGATGTNDLVNANTNTFIGYSTAGSSSSAINQTVIGASTTGSEDNSVFLGNTSVTNVFCGQAGGATVYGAGIQLNNASSGNNPLIKLTNTHAGGDGAMIKFKKDGGSAANDDTIGVIAFEADDHDGNVLNFANMFAYTSNAINGQEQSKINFTTRDGGAEKIPLTLKGTYVGIGNSNPGALLTVGDDTGNIMIDEGGSVAEVKSNGGIYVGLDQDNNGTGDFRIFHGGNSNNILLEVQEAGQIGMGGTPSSAQLHIHGDMDNTSSYGLKVDAAGSDGSNIAYHAIWVDENGDGCGSITSNSSGNSSAYNTSSDYRLKENEVAISDGITRLNQLKPYRFNWKKSPDYIVDGFFAHEVQEIIPEAVVGEKDAVDKDGNIERQMIDHSKLVPLLVAAVKELSQQVEDLKKKVG